MVNALPMSCKLYLLLLYRSNLFQLYRTSTSIFTLQTVLPLSTPNIWYFFLLYETSCYCIELLFGCMNCQLTQLPIWYLLLLYRTSCHWTELRFGGRDCHLPMSCTSFCCMEPRVSVAIELPFETDDDFEPIRNRTCFQKCTPVIVTKEDVLARLNRLNINKSEGPDLIHPRVIYKIRHEITHPLTMLFNRSLEKKQIPDIWKCANISPIYKKRQKRWG